MIRGVLIFLTACLATAAQAVTVFPTTFFASSGYVPPVITSNYLTAYGDSRTSNTGGITWGSPTVTSAAVFGSGYAGFLGPLSGNKFLFEYGYNYGIGAQSSAGIAARVTNTLIYCDDPTATALACFQGLKATMASGTYTTGSTPTITLSGFSGTINNGTTYYLVVNGGITNNCSLVANGTNLTTTSVTVPSGSCIDNTFVVPTQVSIIAFVPAAQFNNYFPFTGGANGSGTDSAMNKVGGGANFPASNDLSSPATDTAQVVALLAGINDSNLGAVQSASNITSIFTTLGPNGPGSPNKMIVVGDEYPSGLATGYSLGGLTTNGAAEVQTIPATPTACGSTYTSNYCVTVHNSGTYFSEPSEGLTPLLVFLAPAGTGAVPFHAGTSDGQVLTYCGSVGCTPSTGQFGVDASGHYAFNSTIYGSISAANQKVGIYYRYTSTTSGRGAFIAELHNWYDSASCSYAWSNSGTYAGAGFAVTMNNPGAKCSSLYPWVTIAPTWNAILDTSSGNNYYNAPYTLCDGLHPCPYGAALLSKAMITAAAAAGALPPTAPYTPPTQNNWAINGVTSISTTNQTSAACNPGNTYAQKYFVTGAALGGVSLSTINGNTGGPAFLSSLVGATLWTSNANYFPAGTTIACIDQANNLIRLSAAATAASSTNYTLGTGYMIAKFDPSLVGGGVFSYAYGSYYGASAAGGTSITGCGTSNASCPAPVVSGWTISNTLPVGWYMALDSNSNTAIAAGTLGFSFGMAQNPLGDGYDGIVIQLQGYGAPSGAQDGATLSTQINNQLAGLVTNGTMARSICRVLVGPGPNGHLTGFTGVQIKMSFITSGTYTAPGMNGIAGESSFTTAAAAAGGGGNEFVDQMVAAGSPNVIAVSGIPGGYMLELDQMTPPVMMSGTAMTADSLSPIVQWNGYDPVSATVLIERCGQMIAKQ